MDQLILMLILMWLRYKMLIILLHLIRSWMRVQMNMMGLSGPMKLLLLLGKLGWLRLLRLGLLLGLRLSLVRKMRWFI